MASAPPTMQAPPQGGQADPNAPPTPPPQPNLAMAVQRDSQLGTQRDHSEDVAEGGETTELGSKPTIFGFDEEGTVAEDYVPEGFDSVEDYLEDMRDNYALDLEADRHNREEAVEDKKFSAGEQWDRKVLAYREGLPCLVINTVPQFTAQLVGDWRQQKNGIKVVPNENGDVDVAEIRSDLIRSIEWRSRAERVYDSSFESMVQCGDGAYQIAVDYANEDVFDQEILIKPFDDALSVVWDRMSVDPTGRDANRCFADETYPRKVFDKLWPDSDPSDLLGSGKEYRDQSASGWFDSDMVRVTAHWRMLSRDRVLSMFADGSIHFMGNKAETDKLVETHGMPVKTRLAPCRYAQMHLVTGFKILAGPFEYRLTRLPIIRMSGRVINVNGKRTRHGLVRFMKDPVRLRNFWRSVAAEQLGYAPKAQWLAPESAVEGREADFRKAHLSRDPLLVYNDGAEAPPQRVAPPQIESALLNEAQVNSQDMKDVTGIHDASLGIKSNETSGKAIMARQREGDVASITYFDNANAALLEGGDIINQLIGQIYDSTRIVRLVGEDEGTRLLKINDPNDPSSPDLSVGNYDVAMTTGPSYTTRRVEAADAMMQAVQVWPQLIQVAGDIIAKAQDWPGAQELAERLRKTIPQNLLAGEKDPATGQPIQAAPQVPPEIQQQMMEGQQQIQSLTSENANLKNTMQLELSKLEVDKYNAETQRLKVTTQSADRQMNLDLKASALPNGQSAQQHLGDLNGR
jgi:hypothetical protein